MLEVKGKYCKDCKIFTDNIEDSALSIIYDILNNPAFNDAKIRIMPDTHAGKGICIGFTCPVGEFVNPNHVGVDIACRMTCMELSDKIPTDKIKEFERIVKKSIPTGFDINTKVMIDEKDFYRFLNNEYNKARSKNPDYIIELPSVIDEKFITKMLARIGMDNGIFYKSLPSLGGGNHFIEYGVSSENDKGYITVHCGSRNFGVKVCNYWCNVAKKTPKIDINDDIKKIKETVKDKALWAGMIDELRKTAKEKNPSEYLSGDNLRGYLSDMTIANAYAKYNHMMFVKTFRNILLHYNIRIVDTFETVHNYISTSDDMMIRKGAIDCSRGRKVIIPFNMRDGIAICEGKGNEDWNCSGPHGAGRIMSRAAAKKNIKLDEFKESMKDVYSTCVCMNTIDESPMAYKDTSEIINLISPTVDILYFIKPVINWKSTNGE